MCRTTVDTFDAFLADCSAFTSAIVLNVSYTIEGVCVREEHLFMKNVSRQMSPSCHIRLMEVGRELIRKLSILTVRTVGPASNK